MKKTLTKKRLSKVARELNVGISTITDYLESEGYKDKFNPNYKISVEQYELLLKKYGSEKDIKSQFQEAKKRVANLTKETITLEDLSKENIKEEDIYVEDVPDILEEKNTKEEHIKEPIKIKEEKKEKDDDKTINKPKIVGKIDLEELNKKTKEVKKDKTKSKKPISKVKNIIKKDKTKKEEIIDKKEEIKKEEISDKKEDVKKEEIIDKKEEIKKEEIIDKKEEVKEEIIDKKEEVKEEIIDKKEELKKEEISDKKEELKKEEISDEKVKIKKEEIIDKKETIKKEESTDNNKSIETDTKKIKIKDEIKVVGKIDLNSINQKTRPDRKTKQEKEVIRKQKEENKKRKKIKKKKIKHLKVTRVILPDSNQKESKDTKTNKRKKVVTDDSSKTRKKTTRIVTKNKRRKIGKPKEIDKKDIDKQIKETLAKLENRQKNRAVKYRKNRRQEHKDQRKKEQEKQLEQEKTIEVTEFITVNEFANMMNVHVNEVIGTCMDLDIPVSINFRLDADTIGLVAEEYNYKVNIISTKTKDEIEHIIEEDEENLQPRPPIITVMGHVDHGKTSLLDHIRKTNVIAGEAGGITQHIGAYHLTMPDGKEITFLDTPGHEAFTAMRARGAKVTDVVIVIIAADDSIMPQTIEAIDHAKAAEVPIVFAINKIDKENADAEKLKRQLADRNLLIEEWGGQYGCVEISAKHGKNIDELLERVLLEAEIQELKANPNRNAIGTVVESSLNKGRGYVTTLLLKTGTLKVGDIVLAGHYYGKVKAMYNERDTRVYSAGPSEPILITGLDGAPEAGDPFVVMESEKEAKEKANYRFQLQREIGFRSQKFLTLDEIGRRIKVGEFKEINIVIKGDVIGSIEALADSISKLATEEIQVNIIHKAVGQISDNDIMLAVASKAVVIGFQVRPSISARNLAEKEQIEIRQYSIIFNAINDVRDAMEGMLSPEIKEIIIGSAEIQKVYKITKVGTIAGCMVRDGKIERNQRVRLIRDGIVKFTGELASLKRFKEDAKEVKKGFECGLNIDRYNDIKVGDFIESFKEIEVKKTL